jgi:hypothetical protein
MLLTVIPARPAGPSEVTTDTDEATQLMAARNASTVTLSSVMIYDLPGY